MGILAFLQSGMGFFLKPVKFGGGGPLLVWLLAIFGAYSMVTGSLDTVKGWLGVSDEQIIAEQKATIELYGSANSDLNKTLQVAIATQENADKVISDTYDKVKETSDKITEISEEKERKLEELGTIVPIIQYESDIETTTDTPLVITKEGRKTDTEVEKPAVKQPEVVTVVRKKESATPTTVEVRKKKPKLVSAYVINKKISEESAQINIDALWTAYNVASAGSGGDT